MQVLAYVAAYVAQVVVHVQLGVRLSEGNNWQMLMSSYSLMRHLVSERTSGQPAGIWSQNEHQSCIWEGSA